MEGTMMPPINEPEPALPLSETTEFQEPDNLEEIKTNEADMMIGQKEIPTEGNHPQGELKLNERYKITGGKYKSMKIGTLVKINPTYSDVMVEGHGGAFEGPNSVEGEVRVKVKNCYLFPIAPPAIDMPDADNLLPVENLEKYLEENPEIAMTFDGTPEINELNELVDNVTDILPSMDEALELRKEVIALKKIIIALKEEQLGELTRGGLTPSQAWQLLDLISKFTILD